MANTRDFRLPTMRPQVPMVAVDRFGKLIEAGHLVMYRSNIDIIFEVVDVRPVLNPGAQMPMVQITMQAQFPVQAPAGSRTNEIVICGESRSRVEAKAGNNGKAEEAKDAPPMIALTDVPEIPVSGTCPACGSVGVINETCTACGDAHYQHRPE